MCLVFPRTFPLYTKGNVHTLGVVYITYTNSGPALEVAVGERYRRLTATLYVGVNDHRTAMLMHCAKLRVHCFAYTFFETKRRRDNVSGEQAARRLGREWQCADLVEVGVRVLDDAMTSVTGP